MTVPADCGVMHDLVCSPVTVIAYQIYKVLQKMPSDDVL